MITISVFVVIFLVLSVGVASSKTWDGGEDFLIVVFGAISGLVIGIFVATLLPCKLETVKTVYNIESLNDGSGVSGNFFLGCGHIDGKMKYTYYYDRGDSTYVLGEIECSKAKIKYTNDKPRIETTRQYKTKRLMNKFSIRPNRDESCIIYVPEGSIIQSYKLDAN